MQEFDRELSYNDISDGPHGSSRSQEMDSLIKGRTKLHTENASFFDCKVP